jgi:hypothetical protein
VERDRAKGLGWEERELLNFWEFGFDDLRDCRNTQKLKK